MSGIEIVELLSSDDESFVPNKTEKIDVQDKNTRIINMISSDGLDSSDDEQDGSFHEGVSFLSDGAIWEPSPSTGIKRATEGGSSPLDTTKRKFSAKPEKVNLDQMDEKVAENSQVNDQQGPKEPNYDDEDEDFMLALTQSIETAEKARKAVEANGDCEEKEQVNGGTEEQAPVEEELSPELTQKELNMLARKQERERKKREKEEEKLAKRHEREQQRAEARALKQKQQEEQTRAKNQAKQLSQQMQGKFSDSEIAMVLHEDIYSSPVGETICEVVGDTYKVGGDPDQLPGSVRWTHRPMTLGGAAFEGEGVEDKDFLAIIFDAHRFLQLIEGGPEDGDYPGLSVAAASIREEAGPRIKHSLWILNGVHEEVDRRFREHYERTQGLASGDVTAAVVDDAIAWLAVSEGVEVQVAKSAQDTAEYLLDLTRALAEAPYKEEITPLHCVTKKKTIAIVEGLGDTEQEAANMFARMLQMIPGVSEKKAVNLIRHYPSLRSLIDEYENQSLTEEEKELVLQGCFSSTTTEKMLSKRIYNFFTADDPNEIIG